MVRGKGSQLPRCGHGRARGRPHAASSTRCDKAASLWCPAGPMVSGSCRDTYGAAGCRRAEKARHGASHAGGNLGLDPCVGLGVPEFSLRFFLILK